MPTIVIDPGHGGHTKIGGSSPNNAKGPNGTLEKNITLAIAKAVQTLMPGYIDLILTRESDVNLGLRDRTSFALEAEADAFVSIHLNGWDTPDVQGTECYHYDPASTLSKELARRVQAEVLKVTQLRDRGVKSAKYGVINPSRHFSQTASCLVEISFMTGPGEEARLLTPSYINDLGRAITDACTEFLAHKNALTGGQTDHVPEDFWSAHAPLGVASEPEEELEDGFNLSKMSEKDGDKAALSDINGIGPVRQKKLNSMGVENFSDLAHLSPDAIEQCAKDLKVSTAQVKSWKAAAKRL